MIVTVGFVRLLSRFRVVCPILSSTQENVQLLLGLQRSIYLGKCICFISPESDPI